MKIKSLIESIKSAITTNASVNYEINDHSFLAELLSDARSTQKAEKSDSELLGITPYFDFRKSEKFPVTGFVLRLIWKTILLVPLCFYKLLSFLYWLLTNHKSTKKKESKIKSARLNFVIFFTAMVTAIILLLTMLSFFIYDIILFDPSQRINDNGAIAMEQPCGSERYVYLYNTAKYWSDTGIELTVGDRVEITASGAYYGRISDLVECADSNTTLPYKMLNSGYISTDSSLQDENLTKLCVYNKSTSNFPQEPTFGALLYQIRAANEKMLNDNSKDEGHKRIFQDYHKNGEIYSFTAKHSGNLYVTINDIYLTDTVLTMIKGLPDSIQKEHLKYICINDSNSSIEQKLNKLTEIARIKPDYWFADNMGEILLNITVNRDIIANKNIAESAYSHSFRHIDKFINQKTSDIMLQLLTVLAIITLLLIADNHFFHKETDGKEQ